MALSLKSPRFGHQEEIPTEYTCEGKDISPPLTWSGIPETAKSMAIIVDDPDAPDPRAPKRTWVHWVVYNLPVDSDGLPAGAGPNALPRGTRQGLNDWSRPVYNGPCPPIGRHRYFYKLYALSAVLPDLGTPTKKKLEEAMEGLVVARAELMGTYEKRG
jgi:Raf kinase inhibitor-like YbhB/YbcL family protein